MAWAGPRGVGEGPTNADWAVGGHLGWLCQIQLGNPAEFEVLLDEEAYKKLSEDA